ncbi:MAG: DegT/DnrJ/EryC1/StrS family aminotransferase [Syntrophobacteraceae bacterium]
MKFIDLPAQQTRIRENIEARIKTVLDHGQYVMGPEIDDLESRLATYTGTRHALACSSGTDALLLALMAYDVGPGDAIITTPFTFFATAEAIALLGAVPVFADIDPVTFNIDPSSIEAVINSLEGQRSEGHPVPMGILQRNLKLKGIIGVDLFGIPADYPRIQEIAAKQDLFVIEDAAQSFGAELSGRKACSFGHLGCTSFFPAKPLGAYGDGGMCFTGDEALAEKIRSIRNHGQGADKYENIRVGLNGRLDTMQAAILLAKMDIFPEEIQLRQKKAQVYHSLLCGDKSPVLCPEVPDGYLSAWAQYSVLTKPGVERAALQNRLKSEGIPTAIYYPRPLHLQTAFSGLGYAEGACPVSEDCAGRIFSLPMHPYLSENDQERIAITLLRAIRE